MQISKFSKLFPALCAAVFCSSLMLVRAADTPAQAAARAALLAKLNETATTTNASPAVIVTPAEVKVETPAPVVVAPAAAPAPSEPVVQPVPAPVVVAAPVADTEAQAKARAALLQKISEAGAPPAAMPPMTPMTPEKIAVEKTETPVSTAPVVAPVAAPMVMEPKPAVVAEPMVKPIETPALPIAATKEERLQALLDKYKADQITPAEYHTERAKIIGEP
jgi:hypothetical protein